MKSELLPYALPLAAEPPAAAVSPLLGAITTSKPDSPGWEVASRRQQPKAAPDTQPIMMEPVAPEPAAATESVSVPPAPTSSLAAGTFTLIAPVPPVVKYAASRVRDTQAAAVALP